MYSKRWAIKPKNTFPDVISLSKLLSLSSLLLPQYTFGADVD